MKKEQEKAAREKAGESDSDCDDSSTSSEANSVETNQSGATFVTGEKQKHYLERTRSLEKSLTHSSPRVLVAKKDGDKVKYSIQEINEAPRKISNKRKTKRGSSRRKQLSTVPEVSIVDEDGAPLEDEINLVSSSISNDSWNNDTFLNLPPIARLRHQRKGSDHLAESTTHYY